MSETIRYTGTLVKLKVIRDHHQNPLETLREDEEYYVKNGILCAVNNKEITPPDQIIEAREKKNDVIEYHLMYYNGGCGFTEALDKAHSK